VVILIMGVAGAGKSTIGLGLARELGWPFFDGDDFHPASNIDKMRQGHALTDADRLPWLAKLHAAIVEWVGRNQSTVLACSILKTDYRTMVEAGCKTQIRLVYLKGSKNLFRERIVHRTDHFMRQELLDSQFAILEEPTDALVINAALSPPDIVRQIRQALGV
jgi:gluconokinase